MSFHLSHSMSDISAGSSSRAQVPQGDNRPPKPVPTLRSRTSHDGEENAQPANHTSHRTQPLASSDGMASTRSSDAPTPGRLPRSMSLSSNIGRRTSVPSDDDLPLKLGTIPGMPNASITGAQLVKLLDGSLLRGNYDRLVIVDARYAYEFNGGHIMGAVNVYLPEHQEELKQRLLGLRLGDRVCVVIHCEFSSVRGPRLWSLLRAFDRAHNEHPNLFFPEMYVLNGGYKEFYEKYSSWCTPEEYIPMHHKDYTLELWEATRQTKNHGSIKSKSLTRSSSDMTRLHTSPLFGGNRESRSIHEESGTGAHTELGNPRAVTSAHRLLITSSAPAATTSTSQPNNRQQDSPVPAFSFSRPSSSSFASTQSSSSSSSSTTMDTCSDTEEDEEESDFLLGVPSPTPARFGGRRTASGGHGRFGAPMRGASFHGTPIRSLNFSTPELPNMAETEDEESVPEMNFGPFTSR